METVLIIEDDLAMRRGLKDNFEFKGYRVKTALDGERGLSIALREKPDLVVLDIQLPKINGYDICSIIRKKNLDIPIIMVTGRNSESDIVRGLQIGADDYMTKPFSIMELLARAERLLRRGGPEEPTTYEFGSCKLDIRTGTLTRDDREVTLSPLEFKVLHLFLRRPRCIFTLNEILNTVVGCSHFITSHDIDCIVAKLRNKIEPDPSTPTFIHTVKGIGYKFEPLNSHGNYSNN